MVNLLPEHRETILGVAEVREVFHSSKFGAAAGCMVLEGTLHRNKPIRVLRDDVVVFKVNLNLFVVIKKWLKKFVLVWNVALQSKAIKTSKLKTRSKSMMFN